MSTTYYNSTNLVGIAGLNAASVSTTLANVITANIQSMNVSGDSNLTGNLITQNIIMSSNLSTNTGQGNVYISANLVVNGNIFSIGGSVGSGSGTSQGVTYTLPSSYSLGTSFATGTAGPTMNGYHINMASFSAQAVAAVSSFSASTGMIKFASAGLYSIQCVLVGDQPATKVGIGSTSSSTFPPTVTATSGYVYMYNYPLNSSPTTLVTIPLTITDTSKWYYLDAYFSTVSGSPTVLYQTAPPSGSAAGSNYGTYIQVGPFGNYLTSATGVAAALLCNCSTSSNLSGSYSSNAYRVTLTSSNGWTVNGTSTAIAVTANGNFQVNQSGLYEVNMCLNTVGLTPVQFQVGSLSSDSLAPNSTTPAYLYSYAPMYTQDPTTAIQLPLNITNTSNVYFVECSFQGTSTANIALNQTSTFVSIKPIGSYVTPATNPWIQQGTSVYYNSGPVGLGVVPTALTETFTVSGNTSFVGNVTQVTDLSSNLYVNARRVPAGSLSVSNYVTGSVPLTTTTNLIQNYLSNAAAVSTASAGLTGITAAVNFPGTVNSYINFGPSTSTNFNLTSSNIYIESWVYVDPNAGRTNFVAARAPTNGASGTEDWRMYVETDRNLYFQVFNTVSGAGTAASGALASGSAWFHFAASYNATGASKTVQVYVNGTRGTTVGTFSGTIRYTSTSNQYIGLFPAGGANSGFLGQIADMRIVQGCIVPTGATITVPTTSAPGIPFSLTTLPASCTALAGNVIALGLTQSYFPGASTSPYGPCLTLPGTVGSYYTETGTFLNTSLSSGFTIEAWVNYASFASANTYLSASAPWTLGKTSATSGSIDWLVGACTTGQFALFYGNGSQNNSLVTAGTITTGSWNHLVVQGNTAGYVNMFINGQIQTLTPTPAGSASTSIALNGTPTINQFNGITIGQQNNNQGPNFAIAKARILFGANTYTVTSFTPNPNLGPVPAGATVAWQLESQYPLPTYPSIQDVTELPQQASSYGSLPTPVGGVTSNTLGPYSTNTSLQSLRFDGTGYIDYGNAATSVMTTNIWANNWTIEAWVYLTSYTGSPQIILSRTLNPYFDFAFFVTGYLMPGIQWSNTTTTINNRANSGLSNLITNSWTHVAVTFDGTNSNVYFGGTLSNSMVVSSSTMWYTPNYHIEVGSWLEGAYYNLNGNLADVRVSNVARYTGSSYTVPTAPFTNDANTLLLLKSLAQQPGTTLEVQGRGLNATSLGATRSIQSYPPAPMSSYLLDTTSNASVSYGQGKYVASASSELTNSFSWQAFNKAAHTPATQTEWTSNNGYSAAGAYTGSVSTVDTLGIAYSGEWLQIQMPVSVILGVYSIQPSSDYASSQSPVKWWILGSRDGLNWSLVDSRAGITTWTNSGTQSFTASGTQAFNYFRLVVNQSVSTTLVSIAEWILNGTEEGFCISNDAKLGVGIANPQRSLEVAGDLVVGGTISGGAGMGSFRNRIINGDMRIAQRGTSNAFTTCGGLGAAAYLLDRFTILWLSTDGNVSVTQQTLVASDTPYQYGFRNSQRCTLNVPLTMGASTYFLPAQYIEGYNITDLNWGTSFGSPVTLSFWFRSNIPVGSTLPIAIRNSAQTASYVSPLTITSSSTWQYVTLTIPPPPNGTAWNSGTTSIGITLAIGGWSVPITAPSFNSWLASGYLNAAGTFNWLLNAGNYIEFTGVQLEKGTVATPWEQRPYATELALCQRYYYQINSSISGNYGSFGFGVQNGSNQVHFATQYPVQMRSNVSSASNFSNSAMSTFMFNSGGGTPGTLNSFVPLTDSSTQYVGRFYIATGSAGTAGSSIELRANGTTSAFLGFSAEL